MSTRTTFCDVYMMIIFHYSLSPSLMVKKNELLRHSWTGGAFHNGENRCEHVNFPSHVTNSESTKKNNFYQGRKWQSANGKFFLRFFPKANEICSSLSSYITFIIYYRLFCIYTLQFSFDTRSVHRQENMCNDPLPQLLLNFSIGNWVQQQLKEKLFDSFILSNSSFHSATLLSLVMGVIKRKNKWKIIQQVKRLETGCLHASCDTQDTGILSDW